MKMCVAIGHVALQQVLDRYGLQVCWVEDQAPIPGSHWGECEAGLVGNKLYLRNDTPLHSALHEACHYICMDQTRRQHLDTDAGGGYDEENGVCYLQILLAAYFDGVDKENAFSDMDEWGYSFRLGSTKRWFYEDADDAKQWLLERELIDNDLKPTWKINLID